MAKAKVKIETSRLLKDALEARKEAVARNKKLNAEYKERVETARRKAIQEALTLLQKDEAVLEFRGSGAFIKLKTRFPSEPELASGWALQQLDRFILLLQSTSDSSISLSVDDDEFKLVYDGVKGR